MTESPWLSTWTRTPRHTLHNPNKIPTKTHHCQQDLWLLLGGRRREALLLQFYVSSEMATLLLCPLGRPSLYFIFTDFVKEMETLNLECEKTDLVFYLYIQFSSNLTSSKCFEHVYITTWEVPEKYMRGLTLFQQRKCLFGLLSYFQAVYR